MYELIQLTQNTYYMKNAVNIGFVKLNEKQVCLIDSGIDKQVGVKIRQILDKNEWELVAIYNTHSHADHIGGNKYLQSQKNCKVYCPEIENFFANNPIFEPTLLNTSVPYKEQTGKFLMAQACESEVLTEANLPECLSIIELAGHCYNMVGFRTTDDVVFLADSLCSEQTLEKYQISYIFDVEKYLETLESLKTIKAKFFVPSHVEVCEDISELIQLNIEKVKQVGEKIVEILKTKMTFENLLTEIFKAYSLSMNQVQYVLISATLRSYLTWLKNNEKVFIEFDESSMFWFS